MEPSASVPDEMVVRNDGTRNNGTFWGIVGVAAAIWVALLLALRSFAALEPPVVHFTWVWAVFLAVITALIGFACYLRGSSAVLTQPWRLSSRGVLAMTPVGVISLPWEAISEVRVSGGAAWRITIQPKADTVPGRGGVESDVKNWPNVLKQGLSVGGPTIQPGRDEILAAIRHYAGDRVSMS